VSGAEPGIDAADAIDESKPHNEEGIMQIHATLRRFLFRAPVLTLVAAVFVACDDDTRSISNPEQPSPPEVSVTPATLMLPEADPALGAATTASFTITNQGARSLEVSSIAVSGEDAGAFSVRGAASATLEAGAEMEVTVAFNPESTGSHGATVAVRSNDPERGEVGVEVSGRGVRFEYAQVDRKGIPALNTVFNHPSGVGPFDKTLYNTSSPRNDVATYEGQFETVLEAVQNENPEATADLLLPDELPVSLGVENTSFADLTGRDLTDDATDVALQVTVGVEALQSDHVDSNDRSFLAGFPYLAEPHR